ncbi:MAG: hypothetical protein PHT69_14795 [Bacteroidales bacterium]|nr:hypothetical protein [Bacteroidales bacterium]
MNISILIKIYHWLPQPYNWKFWVLISVIIKSVLIIYFISLVSNLGNDFKGWNYEGSFAKAGGDTELMYFKPIENLINNGEYSDDLKMPGYGFIYYLLRLVFDKTITANFIILIQLFFSTISVYCLGLIAYMVFNKKILFLLTFFLYLFSIFVSVNDYVLMTESLAASTLIISIYFFMSFFNKSKHVYLLYSGIFITWAIFLRPVLAPILIIYILFLVVYYLSNKKSFKSLFINILFISLSFVIIDGIWIYRNFKTHNKFIPLQRSVYGYGVEKGFGGATYDFVRAIGGDIEFWEPHSELIYFFPESRYFNSNMAKDSNLSLIPKYVYTTQFNSDTLINLRNKIIELYSYSNNDKKKILFEKEITSQINSYTNSFEKEKPFHYYITTRLRSLSTFFTIRGYTWGLIWINGFSNYYIGAAFKWGYTFFYYLIVTIGLIGMLGHFICNKKHLNIFNVRFLLIAISFYLIFSHPILLKSNPNRFLVTGFPFLVVYSAYFFEKIFTWLNLYIKKFY